MASPMNIGRPGPRLGASINGASHDKRHRRTCCYLAHKVRLHRCHQHHVRGIGVRGHHGHFGVANRPSSGNVRLWLDCFRATPSSGRGKHPRRMSQTGRVGMWRGGGRIGLSVAAPLVWRCLNSRAMTPFPHPAHRTGRALLTQPALGQDFTPSPTARRAQAGSGVRARSARKGARVDMSRPCVA